jgi:undecaprenyl-diphosphatase
MNGGPRLKLDCGDTKSPMMPRLLEMLFAFLAGLVALRRLTRWLETDGWYWFGTYCLVATAAAGYLPYPGDSGTS